MERIKALVGILLVFGIVFGTFQNFVTDTPLGWTWFVNMLWFALGMPVLVVIGLLVFDLAGWAEVKAKPKKEE